VLEAIFWGRDQTVRRKVLFKASFSNEKSRKELLRSKIRPNIVFNMKIYQKLTF